MTGTYTIILSRETQKSDRKPI